MAGRYREAGVEGMSEEEFLVIVNSVRNVGDRSALDLPVAETTLDSLDLAALRSSLEVRLGAAISDHVWTGAATLRELLDLLP